MLRWLLCELSGSELGEKRIDQIYQIIIASSGTVAMVVGKNWCIGAIGDGIAPWCTNKLESCPLY